MKTEPPDEPTPTPDQPAEDLTIAAAAEQIAFSVDELEKVIGWGWLTVVLTAEGGHRITATELRRFDAWELARQRRALKALMDYSNEIGFDE